MGLRQAQCLQGGWVGGHLYQHGVARLNQYAHQQVKRLLRSGGDQHIGGAGLHAPVAGLLCQGFAQGGQAFGGAVLQSAGTLCHGMGGGLGQPLGVKQAGGRVAPGQRDHAGAAQVRKQLPDWRSGRLSKQRREGSQRCSGGCHGRQKMK